MISGGRIDQHVLWALSLLVTGRVAMLAIWTVIPTKPSHVVLISILCLDLAVLGWQLLLIHRARRLSGTGLASMLLALITMIAIGFALSTDINRTAAALLREPPSPAARPILKTDGISAHLDEDINFNTYASMQATLQAHPDLQRLTLDSRGGRIAAARGIARLVREAKLDTHVSDICTSACTLIFAAGQNRTMSKQARVGFHGYRLISYVETLNTTDEQDRDKATFIEQGVKSDFIDRAYAVSHDDMWFPSENELRSAGVLTD